MFFWQFQSLAQRFARKILKDPRGPDVDQLQKDLGSTMNYFVSHHIRFDMVIHKEIHSTSQFV